jgi:hypothetical protein
METPGISRRRSVWGKVKTLTTAAGETSHNTNEYYNPQLQRNTSISLRIQQFRTNRYSRAEEPLCEDCQKIDLKSLHTRWFYHQHDPDTSCRICHYKVCELGYLDPKSTCRLCQFLMQIARGRQSTSKEPKNEYGHLVLRAYSARNLFALENGSIKNATVFTVDSGTPYVGNDGHYFGLSKWATAPESISLGFRNTSEHVDWAVVKRWMTFCKEHHYSKCARTDQQEIPKLTVIDCESRRLIWLPGSDSLTTSTAPYITLSYVWGQGEVVKETIDGRLDIVPQVIEDAFQVVKSLGYKYLWVDRYCIPQNNTGEKHRLIQEMGSIYRNSTLTLIAAAGEDPTYGLPGVSVVPRWEMTPIRIGDFDLIPSRQNHISTMKESKWNSRGWTFQESHLSRRRLVFTNGGLYFQCRTSRFLESILLEPNFYCPFSVGDERKELGERLFSDIELSGPAKKYAENSTKGEFSIRQFTYERTFSHIERSGPARKYVENCIREFSFRQFTYETDVLSASRGIFATFAKLADPVLCLSGVPIFQAQSWMTAGIEGSATNRLIHGLLWYSQRALSFSSTYSTLRRKTFPSWTWAGWKFERGVLEYRDRGSLLESDTTHVSIEVVFDDGATMNWQSDPNSVLAYEASGRQPTFLNLRAWTFNVTEGVLSVRTKKNLRRRLVATVGLLNIKISISTEYPEQEMMDALCKIVMVSRRGDCILLRKSPDGAHFERIGTGCEFERYKIDSWRENFKRGGLTPGILESAGAREEDIVIG